VSFHVPESARWLDAPHGLDTTAADGNNGAFRLPSPESGWMLAIIASDGEGWEHVSVHAYRPFGEQQRTPTWKEMAFVKQQFWDAENVCVQFYPRESEYVNNHPHTLHWWRPTDVELPTPPSILVGLK
jgi:hypothetical protein